MEKLRSGVWSQNMVYKPQFGDDKLCPEPHMPPVDTSLSSTGVMHVILASCHVLFELTEKLALGMRLYPTPVSDHTCLPQYPPRPLICGWLPLPNSVTGREDSSPKEFKYYAFENSWKGTTSNEGGYRYSMY